jgi:hypothetical protein
VVLDVVLIRSIYVSFPLLSFIKTYCKGFDQHAARQQVPKHEYRNQYKIIFFHAVRTQLVHAVVGSLFPGSEAVNMHQQQWKTLFSVGPCKGVILKAKGATSQFGVLGGR